MKIKPHIPNFVSLLNLLAGVIGISFLIQGELSLAAIMILVAGIFDFLDGFLARLLSSESELGKQFDSLSDMVSFGVLPGLLAFQLIEEIGIGQYSDYIKYIALIIPVFSAIRLAIFNIDTDQKYGFKGVPTPANAFFWAFLSLAYTTDNIHHIAGWIYQEWSLALIVLATSILLVLPINTMALKMKSFVLKEQIGLILFALLSLLLILFFGFSATLYIYLLYVISGQIQTRFHQKS